MSRKAIDKYCKAVGRQLICLSGTRQELMKGLRAELEELPPKQTENLEKLEVHYGRLSQTAMELQEAVSAGERAIALEHRRHGSLLLGGLAVILFLLLVAYIILNYYAAPSVIIVNQPVYK